MRLTSKTKKDTLRIAKIFLHRILSGKAKKALVVGLSGELGAGKTAFTQAIGKLLGIKRHINSPTFVIMKKYPIAEQVHYWTDPIKNKYKFLFHLDAYRLKNGKELLHLGWQEIIENNGHLVFIEWPENIARVMPKNSHFVHISQNKKGHRNFTIEQQKKSLK